MKRRRFIVGVVGAGVAGRLGLEAFTNGPINHNMSSDDASIGDVRVSEESTTVKAAVTATNEGEHPAVITVKFTPSTDTKPKRGKQSVRVGESGEVSVTWETEYFPEVASADITGRIVNVESKEDIL